MGEDKEEKTEESQNQESQNQESQNQEEEKKGPTIEEAKEERKKLEEVHKKIKAENDRTEKLITERALEGKGFSGTQKKKEETEKEYAQRIMRGEL